MEVENSPEEKENKLAKNFTAMTQSLWEVFKTTLSFADEVDKDATVIEIKKGIDFKGFNVWILIFSIIIASIGLNTNSTAVIIGAMLISPLMGPIIGIGMSLGTNDWSTLLRSGKSLLITVGVSLLTSTLYFMITPFGEAGNELVGRTHPELRDVFIAIFGGLAGIMAMSRNKVTNVIPGVAIATALMPPLCTAGYGIANLNAEFFFGAFYLFLINSVYIALTSFIVIRYLKFPLVHMMDELKENKIKKYIIFLAVFLVIPSIYTLYTSYKKNNFEASAKEFMNRYFEQKQINYSDISYNDGVPYIEISLYGKSKHNINDLKSWMPDFDLDNKEVNLILNEDTRFDDVLKKIEDEKFKGSKYFEDMYKVNLQRIKSLEHKSDSLTRLIETQNSDTIPFNQLTKEIKIQFDDVKQVEFGVAQISDFKKEIKLPTFYILWSNYAAKNREEKKLTEWLKVRLKQNDIRVISR